MKKNERQVRQIEEHAARCGLTPRRLLLKAGKYPTYWDRYVSGEVTPSATTMDLILAVQPEGTA